MPLCGGWDWRHKEEGVCAAETCVCNQYQLRRVLGTGGKVMFTARIDSVVKELFFVWKKEGPGSW